MMQLRSSQMSNLDNSKGSLEQRLVAMINAIRRASKKEEISCYSADSLLREDFGLDSFDLAELTVNIEDAFGVDVFEDGVVGTLGELCKKLEGHDA